MAGDAPLGDAAFGPLGDAPLGDAPLGEAALGDAAFGDAALAARIGVRPLAGVRALALGLATGAEASAAAAGASAAAALDGVRAGFLAEGFGEDTLGVRALGEATAKKRGREGWLKVERERCCTSVTEDTSGCTLLGKDCRRWREDGESRLQICAASSQAGWPGCP